MSWQPPDNQNGSYYYDDYSGGGLPDQLYPNEFYGPEGPLPYAYGHQPYPGNDYNRPHMRHFVPRPLMASDRPYLPPNPRPPQHNQTPNLAQSAPTPNNIEIRPSPSTTTTAKTISAPSATSITANNNLASNAATTSTTTAKTATVTSNPSPSPSSAPLPLNTKSNISTREPIRLILPKPALLPSNLNPAFTRASLSPVLPATAQTSAASIQTKSAAPPPPISRSISLPTNTHETTRDLMREYLDRKVRENSIHDGNKLTEDILSAPQSVETGELSDSSVECVDEPSISLSNTNLTSAPQSSSRVIPPLLRGMSMPSFSDTTGRLGQTPQGSGIPCEEMEGDRFFINRKNIPAGAGAFSAIRGIVGGIYDLKEDRWDFPKSLHTQVSQVLQGLRPSIHLEPISPSSRILVTGPPKIRRMDQRELQEIKQKLEEKKVELERLNKEERERKAREKREELEKFTARQSLLRKSIEELKIQEKGRDVKRLEDMKLDSVRFCVDKIKLMNLIHSEIDPFKLEEKKKELQNLDEKLKDLQKNIINEERRRKIEETEETIKNLDGILDAEAARRLEDATKKSGAETSRLVAEAEERRKQAEIEKEFQHHMRLAQTQRDSEKAKEMEEQRRREEEEKKADEEIERNLRQMRVEGERRRLDVEMMKRKEEEQQRMRLEEQQQLRGRSEPLPQSEEISSTTTSIQVHVSTPPCIDLTDLSPNPNPNPWVQSNPIPTSTINPWVWPPQPPPQIPQLQQLPLGGNWNIHQNQSYLPPNVMSPYNNNQGGYQSFYPPQSPDYRSSFPAPPPSVAIACVPCTQINESRFFIYTKYIPPEARSNLRSIPGNSWDVREGRWEFPASQYQRISHLLSYLTPPMNLLPMQEMTSAERNSYLEPRRSSAPLQIPSTSSSTRGKTIGTTAKPLPKIPCGEMNSQRFWIANKFLSSEAFTLLKKLSGAHCDSSREKSHFPNGSYNQVAEALRTLKSPLDLGPIDRNRMQVDPSRQNLISPRPPAVATVTSSTRTTRSTSSTGKLSSTGPIGPTIAVSKPVPPPPIPSARKGMPMPNLATTTSTSTSGTAVPAIRIPRKTPTVPENIPGYTTLVEVLRPTFLMKMTDGKFSGSFQVFLPVNFNPEEFSQNTSRMVALRICLTKNGKVVEGNQKAIKVEMMDFNKASFMPGTNRMCSYTLDVTNYMVTCRNSIEIGASIDRCEKDDGILICIGICRKKTAQGLLEEVKGRQPFPAERTRKMITDRLAEDEEMGMITESTLPISLLMCPLGKTKIKTPCRGIRCKHYHCFDAGNYLQLMERSSGCPVCYSDINVEDLRIDSFFQTLLQSVQGDVNDFEIKIEEGGKFTIVKHEQKETIALIDDDDEDIVELVSSEDENWDHRRQPKTEVMEVDQRPTSTVPSPASVPDNFDEGNDNIGMMYSQPDSNPETPANFSGVDEEDDDVILLSSDSEDERDEGRDSSQAPIAITLPSDDDEDWGIPSTPPEPVAKDVITPMEVTADTTPVPAFIPSVQVPERRNSSGNESVAENVVSPAPLSPLIIRMPKESAPPPMATVSNPRTFSFSFSVPKLVNKEKVSVPVPPQSPTKSKKSKSKRHDKTETTSSSSRSRAEDPRRSEPVASTSKKQAETELHVHSKKKKSSKDRDKSSSKARKEGERRKEEERMREKSKSKSKQSSSRSGTNSSSTNRSKSKSSTKSQSVPKLNPMYSREQRRLILKLLKSSYVTIDIVRAKLPKHVSLPPSLPEQRKRKDNESDSGSLYSGSTSSSSKESRDKTHSNCSCSKLVEVKKQVDNLQKIVSTTTHYCHDSKEKHRIRRRRRRRQQVLSSSSSSSSTSLESDSEFIDSDLVDSGSTESDSSTERKRQSRKRSLREKPKKRIPTPKKNTSPSSSDSENEPPAKKRKPAKKSVARTAQDFVFSK